LSALFETLGLGHEKAQSLADAIVDFRDPDNLIRLQGAEKSQYQAAGLAWGPKNGPFEDVEEVQQVFGMTHAIYDREVPSPLRRARSSTNCTGSARSMASA
jgi:general secretion pathway protein K